MEIKNYLQELIATEEMVCLPGFGGFISKQVSATLDPSTHLFTPPHKQLAFNDRLTDDGGKLYSLIASRNNFGLLQAEELTDQFVRKLKEDLKNNSQASLEDIGHFFVQENGQLLFKPVLNSDNDPINFGLPQILVKTTPAETNKPFFQKPKDRKAMSTIDLQSVPDPGSPGDNHPEKSTRKEANPLIWLYIVTPLVLIAGMGMFLGGTEDGRKVLASMHVISSSKAEEEKLEESATEPQEAASSEDPTFNAASTPSESFENATSAEETIKKEEAAEKWVDEPVKPKQELIAKTTDVELTTANVIRGKSGRSFIIVGGFSNKKNAIKLREKLIHEGLEAKVIAPTETSPLYRVSLSDFDKKEIAIKKAEELKPTYGESLWVMVY